MMRFDSAGGVWAISPRKCCPDQNIEQIIPKQDAERMAMGVSQASGRVSQASESIGLLQRELSAAEVAPSNLAG